MDGNSAGTLDRAEFLPVSCVIGAGMDVGGRLGGANIQNLLPRVRAVKRRVGLELLKKIKLSLRGG